MTRIKRTLYDSHPRLPLDPDSERFQIISPYHTDGAHIAIVAFGAFFGALARFELGVLLPTATNAFPLTTLLINVSGAFLLGLLIQALVHYGKDVGYRRVTRLLLGTGFMGAFTTYSSLSTSVALLVRSGHIGTAGVYALVSVALGIIASALGIRLAMIHHKVWTSKI